MAVIREFISGTTQPRFRLGRRPPPVPARAYLIDAAGERILWDTGYSQQFLEKTRGWYSPMRWATKLSLPYGTELLHQLKAAGVHPASINMLAVSHFSAGHVSGLANFPGTAVLASEEAWASIDGLAGVPAMRAGHVPELVPLATRRMCEMLEFQPVVALPYRLQPFKHAWAVTKDETVLAVPLPGRAPGHVGAFVHTDAGWELLAFDAAPDARSFRALPPKRKLDKLLRGEKAQYWETLRRLHMLDKRGVRIRLSHEPVPD